MYSQRSKKDKQERTEQTMLSDYIAEIIEEMLNEGNGVLELQRNELAGRVGCVPSQISYVISSRFTPPRVPW